MKKFLKILHMPMPSNINYMWNFGSLLGLCLILQIITGLFLTFHYNNHPDLAFFSINHIMRNVNFGWILRIFHANGASFFFIFIYLHIARGLYFNSYKLMKTWFSGIFIFLILMMTAFIGYVLPWGQMSFWGATVITNLLSAIPYIGNNLTFWIWGGFSISTATLMRFFSLHFIFPFFLLVLILSHILFLHETGSLNPLGFNSNFDKISFFPFFLWKDLLGYMVFFIIFFIICLYKPYFFMDPDNFIPANPLSTPPHIQPEWYFLFAYAILRAIPNKLGGVIALLLSILILSSLSFKNKSTKYQPFLKFSLFIFYINFIFLTFLGACPIEPPFPTLAQFSSTIYFSFFLL